MSQLALKAQGPGPFRGESHHYRDLGDTCREWRPTMEYLAWCDLRWPRKSAKEQVAAGWITPRMRIYRQAKREAGL